MELLEDGRAREGHARRRGECYVGRRHCYIGRRHRCCRVGGVLDWRLLVTGALFLRSACAAILQRALVVSRLLGCANGVACPMRAAVGLYFQNQLGA